MTTTDDHDQDGTAIPQYETNSIDDLAELLDRAGNWAERDVHAEVIAGPNGEIRQIECKRCGGTGWERGQEANHV